MIEAYKYVFSQPGALTAPFNYFRCIFKDRKMKHSTQKIEVPILIIWVSPIPLPHAPSRRELHVKGLVWSEVINYDVYV